ncbi:ABC transporter ATP-binding protein [Nonomuraea aridisoli]|uniref:ABC transporter ATP-binding protein n=1 Tax=Nonomuraea aridisoli TaxID=2070368 RepID=A0A2W2EQF4_9ACTN|nr:ABC transporter ATP-binding protein [Nonomuraea aridisoli]PZG15840.1 ABC transporter ATP-binding protein [Nonomuraea aridisoli]
MAVENAIEIRGLTKSFEGFTLRNVDLVLPRGYVMGLVGPNGSGKTTLIKCLLGLLHADSGTVRVLGREVTPETGGHPGVGAVLDRATYAEDWNLDEVGRAVGMFGPAWSTERYRALLDRFGLDRKRKVKDLSRGMTTKLMVAAALARDVELLILDEPTSGLDPTSREQLLETLQDVLVDDRRAVLFSTHITADLETIADHVTVLLGGEVFAAATTDELLDAYRLVRGGPADLSPALREALVAVREHRSGFEGLGPAADLAGLDDVVVEPARLDQIVAYLGRS